MTRGRRGQVFGSDFGFRGGLEAAPETIVVAGRHREAGRRIPFRASRRAGASFRLGQIEEVQTETPARMLRDGPYGPAFRL